MRAPNPVLRGWHPDPCVCKGPDGRYFLVVSTFQWMPAVSCYESRDLVHWTCRGGLLPSLDLSGIPDSAGIWAPDLTYADGKFWLVYTIARGIDGIFKDVENYLVTAPNIDGPCSEPLLLNVSGFDPGVFHEGGRHYVANPQWDPRPLPGHRRFNGIILQEFDENGLVGEAKRVLDNDDAVNGLREGPHILRHEGYYYLACAEGGTGRRHRIRMARSECLWGPYEVCPEPLVCSWESDAHLRKAGHGNLFEGPDGSWYVCHLCSRYLPGTEQGMGENAVYTEGEAGCSPLGRETAIQRMVWQDGWPRLADGGIQPRDSYEVELPDRVVQGHLSPTDGQGTYVTDFSSKRDLWCDGWLAPRMMPSWMEWSGDGLVLEGRGSLTSLFDQALLARRISSFSWEARTSLAAKPTHYNHMAGIACVYDTRAWLAAYVSFDERRARRVLHLMVNDEESFDMPLGEEGAIPVPDDVSRIDLSVHMDEARVRFSYGFDGGALQPFALEGKPIDLDARLLSDEYQEGWAYTGAMVGIFCSDTFDRSFSASFSSFSYRDILEGVNQ